MIKAIITDLQSMTLIGKVIVFGLFSILMVVLNIEMEGNMNETILCQSCGALIVPEEGFCPLCGNEAINEMDREEE